MGALEDLVLVLQDENRLLQELVKLSAAKQNQINDAQKVGELAAQELEVLTQLEVLDQKRALLFDAAAPGRSLEEWALGLEEEQQRIVAPLLADLVQNLAALQSLNNLNQQLLKESLAYVQFSLNVLLGEESTPTYARTGPGSPGKTIFDRKV